LDAEADYIAQENLTAAAEMFVYIKAKVDALSEFPSSGRPGRVPGTRDLIIDQYPFVVPYRVVGDELHVLRVFILAASCQKLGERVCASNGSPEYSQLYEVWLGWN